MAAVLEAIRPPGAPWRGYGILFEVLALPGDWFPLGAADLAGAAPLPGPIEHRCFRCWTLADCGHPLIDAQLRELLATGYLSNRGRQWVSWRTPISPGAKNSTPMASGWLTPGRANSLGPMISTMAGSGLRLLATTPPWLRPRGRVRQCLGVDPISLSGALR